MLTVMRAEHGVGLAANQIGIGLRLIVVGDRALPLDDRNNDMFTARERRPVDDYSLSDPEMLKVSNELAYWFEGCLSFPGYMGLVPRPRRVRVTGISATGKRITFDAGGWHARILAHEIDHLNGILYTEKVVPKGLITKDNYIARFVNAPTSELMQQFKVG